MCEEEPTRLIDAFGDADVAFVVDAVSTGAPAGNATSLRRERGAGAKPRAASSTHALGIGDSLELARALGRLPRRTVVFGVEGSDFLARDGMTAPVAEAVATRLGGGARGGGRMHERAVMRDLVGRILELARAEGASKVTQVEVRLGALSHFTPEHFREHFADTSRGTPAEGAVVEAVLSSDATDSRAADVVLESVELEVPG